MVRLLESEGRVKSGHGLERVLGGSKLWRHRRVQGRAGALWRQAGDPRGKGPYKCSWSPTGPGKSPGRILDWPLGPLGCMAYGLFAFLPSFLAGLGVGHLGEKRSGRFKISARTGSLHTYILVHLLASSSRPLSAHLFILLSTSPSTLRFIRLPRDENHSFLILISHNYPSNNVPLPRSPFHTPRL